LLIQQSYTNTVPYGQKHTPTYWDYSYIPYEWNGHTTCFTYTYQVNIQYCHHD